MDTTNGNNSFQFYGPRTEVSRLAIQRFETGPVALAAGSVFALVNTSRDILAADGRNQAGQLKDIELGMYFPLCDDQGTQVLSSTIIAGVYIPVTYNIRFNSQTLQFPEVFNKNVDRIRSPLWYALFPEVIKSLSVTVRIDAINAAFVNFTAYFFADLEIACVTPN